MGDHQISLSLAERECLVSLLERALKETRVEEHRTRTPSYREHIVEQENAIQSILGKLGQPVK
jgi:hypothetical protein